MSDNVNVKRIAKNTIMLYVRMLLIMVVSLYTARIVLKVLGIEDFGINNVVAGVVAMFGFFNSAMTMATQRFLNVEMGKGNSESLNRTFKMAVNIHVLVAILVLILSETLGIYLVNSVLNIPLNRLTAANWIFQFAVIGACFTIIQVPYNSLIYAREKMNVYAYISIGEAFLKLLLVFLLSIISWDKLVLYGLLILCSQALVFLLYFSYCKRKFQESNYSVIWDNSIFKQMAGFMGWNIFGQTAQILTTQGVNMIANVFYGVVLNAAMGVTNQVNTAVSSFVHNFQTSFRPQIMKSYAADEINGMNGLVIKASKMSFYLLYFISVPLMFNIDFVLSVWLEEVPSYSGIFCKLLIWYTYIEALGLPLVMSIMATGKNRNYQIAISLVLSLNLLLTWDFLKLGFRVETIFIVKIAVSLLALFIRLSFAQKQADMSITSFFKYSLKPIIYVLIITQPCYYIFQHYYDKGGGWLWLLLTLILEIVIVSTIYFVGMTSNERLFVKNGINKFINRNNR